MSNSITDNISKSILGSTESVSTPSFTSPIGNTPSYSTATAADSGNGFLDFFQNINATTWILIILVLAFLGINIFVYLAKGTQDIASFFTPLIDKITSLFGGVTSQIVDVTAEGTKGVVDTAAGAVNTTLSAVQQTTPGGLQTSSSASPNQAKTSISNQPVQTTMQQMDSAQANALNKALNTSNASKNTNTTNDYQADQSQSTIQGVSNKAGWCFIGEDNGYRTCGEVGPNDTCLSGDIFPSQEICVNPSLRA